MEIESEFINEITNEIDTVVKKMKKEKDFSKKLYYFSGIHGLVQRLYNLHYQPKLLYMHFILSNCYYTINARIQQNIIEEEKGKIIVPIETNFFDELINLCKELKSTIVNIDDEGTNFVLLKIVCHTYKVTGNGYYLMEKDIELVPKKLK